MLLFPTVSDLTCYLHSLIAEHMLHAGTVLVAGQCPDLMEFLWFSQGSDVVVKKEKHTRPTLQQKICRIGENKHFGERSLGEGRRGIILNRVSGQTFLWMWHLGGGLKKFSPWRENSMHPCSEVGEGLWKSEEERMNGVEGGEEVMGAVISWAVETSM